MEIELTDRQCRTIQRFIYRTLHNKGIEAEVTVTPGSVIVVPLLEWSQESQRGEDGVIGACISVARVAVSRALNVHTVGHSEITPDGYPHEYAHIVGVPYSSFSIEVCVSPVGIGECRCDY
mgnify:CR=1 FL=1